MKRLNNWEQLLAAEIERSLKLPFEWGAFDCALAACNFIRAQTGVDPATAYRGKYKTEAGANALIGGDLGTFSASIAASLGMQEVAPLFAGVGDLVLVNNGTTTHASVALGIVDSTGQCVLCAGTNGLMRVRMRRWKRAWRVG